MQTLQRPVFDDVVNLPAVESVMKKLVIAFSYEKMTDATDRLVRSKSSTAVVVDGLGICVGVLTRTDVRRYFGLWIRFLENDESVLSEIFETNAFGMLRLDQDYFHQVGKHMTSPGVSIARTATTLEAVDAFERNENIHHLIVVDENTKPIGILEKDDLFHWESAVIADRAAC